MEKKKTNPIILFMLGIIIILLVAVVVLIFYFRKESGKGGEGSAAKANDFTTSVIMEEGQEVETTDTGYYTIQMDLVGTSDDGETFKGVIANALENTCPVYVTIVLDDTGEEVFRSGVIEIGSQMDTFTLSKKLDKGDHSAVLTFHKLDANDTSYEISTVNVAYTLTVN